MFRRIFIALCTVGCCIAAATPVSTDSSSGASAAKQAIKPGPQPVAKRPPAPKEQKFTGYLIDNHCVALHRDSLASYIKTHTRECMQKNGMGRFSLYVDGKVLPVCGEVSGCFQTYVEHFNEGLKIDAWGYMKGDSLYVNRYRAVAQQTSAR